VVQVEVFDLCRAVAEMETMLKPLLIEETILELDLPAEPLHIRGNRGQFEQVVMNLVINARDAMSGAGNLHVALREVVLDNADVAARPEAVAGPHALLVVRDSGCGMEANVIARVFEPFFSTKPPHKGTGLGLSVVYGIVRQSRGHIAVDSSPREGTTFRIYIPVASLDVDPEGDLTDLTAYSTGSESVLVCEDDTPVRELTTRILENAGYRILPAEDAAHALEIAATHKGRLDMLLTDLVMPGMDGKRLAQELTRRIPDLKILFMSGHAHDLLAERELLGEEGPGLLKKPFSREDILRRVRGVLDEQ